MTNEIQKIFESYVILELNGINTSINISISYIFTVNIHSWDLWYELCKYAGITFYHYGYYICLAVMFVIAVVLIIFFRRKKWF